MSVQFLESIFPDAGTYPQHPRFFNGRILTAEDLRDEQAANLRRSQHLGNAAGEGVVYGLYVTKSADAKTLKITNGLAINRCGDTLFMTHAAEGVQLVLEEPQVVEDSSTFVTCKLVGETSIVGSVPAGYHLLAITGASRLSKDFARHSGLNGTAPSCSSRYEEIGVQLKLIHLGDEDFTEQLTATDLKRQSLLAHQCFGTAGAAVYAADPLKSSPPITLVDRLRDGPEPRLTDCDVPLAVLQFGENMVQFVDVWSVRRPCLPGQRPEVYPSHVPAIENAFGVLASPQRAVEAMAFFLQFQNQLEELRIASGQQVRDVRATDHFVYLPAAGFLPTGVNPSSSNLFSHNRFFGVQLEPCQLLQLDPAYVRSILQESLHVEPIPLEAIDKAIDVDLYCVADPSATEPAVLFVRRMPLAVDSCPKPALGKPAERVEPVEPGPEVRTADLTVTVLDAKGNAYPIADVDSVTATSALTAKTYTGVPRSILSSFGRGRTYRNYLGWLDGERTAINAKYAIQSSAAISKDVVSGVAEDWITSEWVYVFDNIPAGTYTVVANPKQSLSLTYGVPVNTRYQRTRYGVARRVDLTAGASKSETLVIGESTLPVELYDPCLEITPGFPQLSGVNLKCLPFDPSWIEIWKDPFPDPGWIDPPPDDWTVLDDPLVRNKVEERLGGFGDGIDPRVVTEDPTIYVRNDYRPDQPSGEIDAFIQTKDGTRFPMLIVPQDFALATPVPVSRAEIAGLDAATAAKLGQFGLGSLEVAAVAPAQFMAQILGHSADYSTSLVKDMQETLQKDFQQGYMGIPGVNRALSRELVEQIGNRVDFANVSPADTAKVDQITGLVSAKLGPDASNVDSFVNRLFLDVRKSVPVESFDLSKSGIIEPNDVSVFENAGVTTLGELATMDAETAASKGISEELMNKYKGTAANFKDAQVALLSPKSLITVPSMTPDVAKKLNDQGVFTALDLAGTTQTPEELAATSKIPADVLGPLVSHATIATLFAKDDATTIIESGKLTPGVTLKDMAVINNDIITRDTQFNALLGVEAHTLKGISVGDVILKAETLSNALSAIKTQEEIVNP